MKTSPHRLQSLGAGGARPARARADRLVHRSTARVRRLPTARVRDARWILIARIVRLIFGRMVWRAVRARERTASSSRLDRPPAARRVPKRPRRQEVARCASASRRRCVCCSGTARRVSRQALRAAGRTIAANTSTSCPGTSSSARPVPARPPRCSIRVCAFPLADRLGRAPRSGASAAPATATGGSPTRRCCSTPPAATRRRTATGRSMPRRGALSCSCSRYRPRRPINGALVTVSVRGPAAAERRAKRESQATAMRQRMQELHERWASASRSTCWSPKRDLLAGFMEFFAALGKEEREQVWGIQPSPCRRRQRPRPRRDRHTSWRARNGGSTSA